MRIVSLVPSLTATLVDLGLKDKVVGCTKFCVRPKDMHRVAQVVGGTKDPDLKMIAALQPTHIIVNSEENKPEHINACRDLAPTLATFPKGPRDVSGTLRQLGEALAIVPAANRMAKEVEGLLIEIDGLRAGVGERRGFHGQRYLYFIWREPPMVAGPDSYIHGCLELLGGKNVAPPSATSRYPEMTKDGVAAAQPDLLLLSSEPYPFRQRDADRWRQEWGVQTPIYWIDGQLFSWYGSVTLEMLTAMRAWYRGAKPSFLKPM